MPQFNAHVLMSDAHAFSTNLAINPYYGNTAPNIAQVRAEHASIKQLLESAGVTVTPKITELVKGGGYIRCTTLSFNDEMRT